MLKENCGNCKHLRPCKKHFGFWKWYSVCTALINGDERYCSEEDGYCFEVDYPNTECCEMWEPKEGKEDE